MLEIYAKFIFGYCWITEPSKFDGYCNSPSPATYMTKEDGAEYCWVRFNK